MLPSRKVAEAVEERWRKVGEKKKERKKEEREKRIKIF